MGRSKEGFVCEACGYRSPVHYGRCPGCGAFGTMGREVPTPRPGGWVVSAPEPVELVALRGEAADRISLPFPETVRVLGGGLVPGGVYLLAGDPGIGKSTLLLQWAGALASRGPVLYVAGEESGEQVRMRAERLDIPGHGILLLNETRVEGVLEALERTRPFAALVDSVQTLACEDLPPAPGSVPQVRESARRLLLWAKAQRTPLVMTGHMTKEGEVAGPRVLEHMVDVVLMLEGDPLSGLRLLRAVKNRFGPASEVALLEMGANGLREVADPSRSLLQGRQRGAVGSAVAPAVVGSRPLLVEVQALTPPSGGGFPQRQATGLDPQRLRMLVAVLSQRARLPLESRDVLVNLVGGLRISEPALDLPLCLAVASSLKGVPLPPDLVALGEVGLTGEVRPVPFLPARLAEARRLGFRRALLPAGQEAQEGELEALRVHTLGDALRLALPPARRPRKDLLHSLLENPETREVLARALEVERANASRDPGWEWFEVQASPALLRRLVLAGILKVTFRSNRATYYRLADPEGTARALAEWQGKGAGWDTE